MRYLLDTNIVFELLLNRPGAADVELLLRNAPEGSLAFSDFSIHSLGVYLLRRDMGDTFVRSIGDLITNGGVVETRLTATELSDVIEAAGDYGLDFDDAYQYTLAEKYALTLVSFDADFDRTARGRKTPAQVLEQFQAVAEDRDHDNGEKDMS